MAEPGAGLGSCDQPLLEAYDVAVLDLDGVVYVGDDAVPGAPEALNAAQSRGMHLAFVTNNAARTPVEVGEHLRRLGVQADDDDVVTSAQAAARLLAEQLAPGSRVFVIGGHGLVEALAERDLVPTTTADDRVAAVAQGYGPEMPWRLVVEGAILVRDGLPWVATNMDLTIPTKNGVGPGNGTLVELVARYADRRPQVAGKPARALFEETIRRVGGDRPLVIGDRLDTDIAGARAMGWDSLLVLTGVTGLEELVNAGPDQRPTYLGADLEALSVPQRAAGGRTARVQNGRLQIESLPDAGTSVEWWRAVAEAAWQHLDDTGDRVLTDGLRPPG